MNYVFAFVKSGKKVVIAGSPDDSEKGQFIENYVKSDNLINLVGQTTMAELIELIRHCHISSALIRGLYILPMR